MDHDDTLDTVGLLCPLPTLKIAKRMRRLAPGQVLRVTVDDPAAIVDIPHFCREQGHAIVSFEEAGGTQIYHLRKGAGVDRDPPA